MRESKFDLCNDTATLDYTELMEASAIAVRYSLRDLETRLRVWYNVPFKCTSLDASLMLESAKALAVATRAYHYLTEARSRENIILERD